MNSYRSTTLTCGLLAAAFVGPAIAQHDAAPNRPTERGTLSEARPSATISIRSGRPALGETIEVAVTPTGGASLVHLELLRRSDAAGRGPTTPIAVLGPVPATGPQSPATFALPIPDDPHLAGSELVLRAGLVGELGNSSDLVLTLEEPAATPELRIAGGSASPAGVAPGESVAVHAVVHNDGDAGAANVRVRASDGSGWGGETQIEWLAAGERRVVRIPLAVTADRALDNPHWFAVEVDPDDRVSEGDESDNRRTLPKPVFVVEPELVAPAPIEDRDVRVRLVDGEVVERTVRTYGPEGAPRAPRSADRLPELSKPAPLPALPPTADERIDPRVRAAEARLAEGQRHELLVTYEHGVPMPWLPGLVRVEERFAPVNLPILERRIEMFEGVRRAQIAAVADLVDLVEAAGGEVLEHFTLGSTMRVDAPAGLLALLEGHPRVLRIDPTIGGEPAPGDVIDARVFTRAYYNSTIGHVGAGHLAMLDTGVRPNHVLLSSPDPIRFEADCSNGDGECNDIGDPAYDPSDSYGLSGHGTATAAILVGNDNMGLASEGVTIATLDSWKVYRDVGSAYPVLDYAAVLRGFDQAVLWGSKVICAQVQADQPYFGSIAIAADTAAVAGTMTIAPVGNYGPVAGSVRSPAKSHGALAAGAFDMDSLVQLYSQSRGPTGDGRIKPEFQLPTLTKTASALSDTATGTFGTTSGAAPYAAGAAMLLTDRLDEPLPQPASQGHLYAAMISNGPLGWGQLDNTRGTGKLRLQVAGGYDYGSRTLVGPTPFHPIPLSSFVTFTVPKFVKRISVALWWREFNSEAHSDIDLWVKSPSGAEFWSTSGPSVFELVVVDPDLVEAGVWQFEIRPHEMPKGKKERVYYAVNMTEL